MHLGIICIGVIVGILRVNQPKVWIERKPSREIPKGMCGCAHGRRETAEEGELDQGRTGRNRAAVAHSY